MERHRIVVAVALAIAPVAGTIAVGCSDDEPAPAGMTQVDPGGTFGAEVSVRVVGRGRVTGSIPYGIDCPTNCYARYTFASQTDRGAADGLTLKATASKGARFVGWKFENDQLGTRGRGPDNCNPVKRAAAQPGDSPSAELKLAYGEVQGTAPPGQEGTCTGTLLTVPVAYKLVATFEEVPIIEAGPDVDGGDAGSPGTVLFDQPVVGATGGDIFIVNGRLYWRFASGGVQGIASGLTTAIGPTTPQVVVTATNTIPRFEGDTSNLVFQQGDGTMGVFNSSYPTTPQTSFTSVPASCDAVDSYSSTVYCLAAGTLYGWSYTGGARTTILSGAPSTAGRNFIVDGSYYWFVNDPGSVGGASIQRMLMSSADLDGGAASLTTVISGQTNPIRLQPGASTSYQFWIQYSTASDLGEVHAAIGSSTVYVPIPAENGLRYMTPDPSSSSYVIAGVAPQSGTGGKIYRTYGLTNNATTITPAVTGIPNLTGLAADSSYYYWTQNDGRVYRKSR